MCGISGIAHPRQGPGAWRDFLHDMTSRLTHRGPDEDGFLVTDHASLGMRRLSVMDPAGGRQPISNEDGTVSVVLNGEIYRFEALRADLESRGHRFKTHSDTEVLVHLYEQYGLDFFRHFDGMFAFALWDAKRRRLIVGRDRFGIKPLFWTKPDAQGTFAFCSELSPLAAMPGLSRALDPVALDHFFTLSYIPHPRSVYRDIKKLAPGSFLLMEDGRLEERRYHDLPYRLDPLTADEAPAALDAALRSATQAMMRSDVPVGAFLSGGMDSSTVVYHMAQLTPHPVQTFSVRFHEKSFDEGDQSALIARHLGTQHHEIWAGPDTVERLPQLAAHFGEPFADPSQIPTFMVSQLARQTVTVALSGDGGDEILGGYETYPASLIAGWTQRLPETIRRFLLAAASRLPVSLDHVTWDYKLRKFLMGCNLPPLEHHQTWRTIFHAEHKRFLYSPAFQNALGPDRNRPAFADWQELMDRNDIDRLTRYQFLDIRTYLTDNNLTKVDRMSMAHSLEVRIPFLDEQVAMTGFRIPPTLRVRGLTTKRILRRLMKGRLPESVLAMPKRGFAVPLAHWFKGPLEDELRQWLNPSRIAQTGLLLPDKIPALIEEHKRGRTNLSRQLWNILCFLAWWENSPREDFR